MKSLLPISLLVVAAISLTGSTASRSTSLSSDANEGVQLINVTAKKYEFNPPTIHVKQGARVQLKINATDHTHGFKISEYANGADVKGNPGLVFSPAQQCQKIEKGQTATVEFVAQAPGTYPFRCCVHCGWHHGAMKGQLIVEP